MEFETLYVNFSSWLTVRTILLIVLPLLYFYWYKRPHKFPSGPRGFPIFGVIPYLSNFPAKDFKKWSQEKGDPVISVRFGSDETVVLNTFDAINQCFVKNSHSSSGRSYIKVFSQITRQMGLVNLDYGEIFKAQKHFGLKYLRSKGLGKKLLEDEINAEGDIFIDYIGNMKGPVNFKVVFWLQFYFCILASIYDCVQKYLYLLTANVISKMALGKRYEYEDPDFQNLLTTMNDLFSNPRDSPKISITAMFYPLVFIPPFSGAVRRFNEGIYRMIDVMQQNIDQHKKTVDENNIGDYIDAFLVEQKNGKMAKEQGFTDFQLAAACLDLFVAGSETSSTTLCWLFVYFLNFPKYKQLIEDEIADVLGSSGLPTMAKRMNMPVTCAFIQEVMRIKTIVPLGVPHKLTAKIEMNGSVLPEGTKVFSNLYGAHMDPETWPNPESFNPHRHIDENGKFVASNKIIPFSIGSRFCLGESLARVEIFVFFVKIVQKFHVRCADENRLPPTDKEIIASILSPLDCMVSLSLRD